MRQKLWFICSTMLLLFLFAVVAFIGCSDSDNDNDDGDSNQSNLETDDCGYKIVQVPEGCSECHGAPPTTSRHPENNRCHRCHGAVVNEDLEFIQPELHKNGTVDYAVGCSSCHGWNKGTSPPQNLKGECGEDKRGVGNHDAMRRAAIQAHRVNCNNCHVVPTTTWQNGHIDGDGKVEVTFANMAVLKGAKASYDGTTCSNVYCHGATLTGGTHKNPKWGDTSGKAGQCGACHQLTDPSGDATADCSLCHPTSLDKDRNILPRGTHINGYIDMPDDSKKGKR